MPGSRWFLGIKARHLSGVDAATLVDLTTEERIASKSSLRLAMPPTATAYSR
jgi:hypothetical protein